MDKTATETANSPGVRKGNPMEGEKNPAEAGLFSNSVGKVYFFAGADFAADAAPAMKLSKFCSATRNQRI